MIKRESQKGFTLFIAVVIAALLLTISYGIINIVTKEVVLSSSARESQFAFYAADTGRECSLYWDQKDGKSYFDDVSPEIQCDGHSVIVDRKTSTLPTGLPASQSTFTIEFNQSPDPALITPYCVTVIVKKAITKQYHENDDPDGAVIAQDSETDITSDGFNTCDVNN
ncbi:pilus assembly PilX N-terminal domain-containing protein, partial [Candidatus Parcubacteria bacterium]|nr:pilus assembly PilX N-terminal domain-containing protein [Candidatus Parcubacteria bacterium]